MNPSFYLDYNATTPLLPEVAQAMQPYGETYFGNPSSIHGFGQKARNAIDGSRETLAKILGVKTKEIIFTSGGTESNNLAILGLALAQKNKGRHIVTCATEHHAVLHPCKRLEEEGFSVTYLPVDSQGKLDLDRLKSSLKADTILVSIMSANNETGALHPVREIGKICREKKVPFHCDAIQSFGKEPVNAEEWQADLLSLTAHKFYGPKGAALLYVKSGLQIHPMLLGGFHENERRAGTENVSAIVGMAKAAEIALKTAEAENKRLFDLTEKLWKLLSTAIKGIQRNGDPVHRIGNTLNVSFEQCDGDALLVGLDLEGIAVSSGSACMVGSVQPSHVLQAMGVSEKLIRATVRFSLGKDSQEKDLVEITERTERAVKRLREKKS